LGEALFSVDELDDLLKELSAEEVKELSAIDPDVRIKNILYFNIL
jgi:hypothetical protein